MFAVVTYIFPRTEICAHNCKFNGLIDQPLRLEGYLLDFSLWYLVFMFSHTSFVSMIDWQ